MRPTRRPAKAPATRRATAAPRTSRCAPLGGRPAARANGIASPEHARLRACACCNFRPCSCSCSCPLWGHVCIPALLYGPLVGVVHPPAFRCAPVLPGKAAMSIISKLDQKKGVCRQRSPERARESRGNPRVYQGTEFNGFWQVVLPIDPPPNAWLQRLCIYQGRVLLGDDSEAQLLQATEEGTVYLCGGELHLLADGHLERIGQSGASVIFALVEMEDPLLAEAWWVVGPCGRCRVCPLDPLPSLGSVHVGVERCRVPTGRGRPELRGGGCSNLRPNMGRRGLRLGLSLCVLLLRDFDFDVRARLEDANPSSASEARDPRSHIQRQSRSQNRGLPSTSDREPDSSSRKCTRP